MDAEQAAIAIACVLRVGGRMDQQAGHMVLPGHTCVRGIGSSIGSHSDTVGHSYLRHHCSSKEYPSGGIPTLLSNPVHRLARTLSHS